jgi:hypothetical protein
MGASISPKKSLLLRVLAAAIAAALLSTLVPGLASPYSQERMDKDITIMENVINTAMVESEYVCTFPSSQNVRGLYIPEFGALFTVQVQLISNRALPWVIGLGQSYPGVWNFYWDQDKWEGFIKNLEDLDIEVNGEKIDLKDYLEEAKRHDDGEKGDKKVFIKPEENEELVKRNLEKFKDELAGIVADYGGTIRQLEANQWIMVVAYLEGTRSMAPDSKVIVKAKKADLDLYDYGKIDLDELESRMEIDSY